ncbi:hypothetical protein [Hafnia psychrotolerans]|uniref:LTD domain-containing protein n=1 Tax=Hafnia psychrotolerans TaxID=1477018 RepID=A0ABQ1H8E6_9GAMM|nr:hypothetical protein [Hafnia psychrotolerans]GGA61774.1 hypothetical protein GCM10011328_41320 [Hafnia psychrotolerans]
MINVKKITMKYFYILFFTPHLAHATYYNEVSINGSSILLDKNENAILNIIKNHSDTKCKINNWNITYNNGAGVISLTTDKKAILLANTQSYLYVDEVINCQEGGVSLHKVPVPNSYPFGTVIDLNFEKKIYLSVVLEDISTLSYTAIVSKFDSNKNIINAKGFENKQTTNKDNSFYLEGSSGGYGGKISINGKYIFPVNLDCSSDSFPGIWDLENKKRVVFSSHKNSSITIDEKCHKLFNGVASLEELGGELVSK